MKKLFTICLFTLLSIHLSAWNELRVSDVNTFWYQEQGSIENIYITVSPKGIFAECEVIIDFTASHLSFYPEDSLEVELNFDLPENSIVTDLWLWIFGNAEQATIHDRWTASLIYESIVQRRIDPAILTKNWGDAYNLKVFPIMINMPRRVKITYLTPILNSMEHISSIPLPLNIIKTSEINPEKINIYFNSNSAFCNPLIRELPQKKFGTLDHPETEPQIGVDISSNINNLQTLNLTFENKINEVQACVFENLETDENFYQLNILPEQVLNVSKGKKVVFLIDYIDQNCGSLEGEELLLTLKNYILQSFSDTDSINLMFSGMYTAKASDKWISCSSSVIEGLFNSLSSNFFNAYSNLAPLLADGVEFIKSNGKYGKIVLISSGKENGSNSEANDLVNDLIELIDENEITIHITDLYDLYEDNVHYIGGRYYRGNEYLYTHLAQKTLGESLSIRNKSLQSIFNQTFSCLSAHFKNLVVQLEFDNGYAYSVYNMKENNNVVYYDTPIQQVGKYIGDLPMLLNIYAQLSNGDLVKNELSISEENLLPGDSSLSQVWASKHIEQLINASQSNITFKTIVETSIEARVLCNYSAFLVLEPGFIPDIDPNSDLFFDDIATPGGNWATMNRTETSANKNTKLSNYPNPFTNTTAFEYNISEPGQVQLILMDIHGREIEIIVDEEKKIGTYTISLNGNDLKSGLYFCHLRINNKLVASHKIIKL